MIDPKLQQQVQSQSQGVSSGAADPNSSAASRSRATAKTAQGAPAKAGAIPPRNLLNELDAEADPQDQHLAAQEGDPEAHHPPPQQSHTAPDNYPTSPRGDIELNKSSHIPKSAVVDTKPLDAFESFRY